MCELWSSDILECDHINILKGFRESEFRLPVVMLFLLGTHNIKSCIHSYIHILSDTALIVGYLKIVSWAGVVAQW